MKVIKNTNKVVLNDGGFYDLVIFNKKHDLNIIKQELASISEKLMKKYESDPNNNFDGFTYKVINELGKIFGLKSTEMLDEDDIKKYSKGIILPY